jgi:hypothetical protein
MIAAAPMLGQAPLEILSRADVMATDLPRKM